MVVRKYRVLAIKENIVYYCNKKNSVLLSKKKKILRIVQILTCERRISNLVN